MSLAGIKIKDGLFVGDCDNAEDIDSILACKLTRVINCSGKVVRNHYESLGIKYLKYDWEDAGSQIVLDKEDKVINEIYDFIEEALAKDEGVLIHSFLGQSRSCCVCAAYLMRRYSWSLNKALEFLRSRQLGTEIKMGLLQQLQSFEKRLAAKRSEAGEGPLEKDWRGEVGSACARASAPAASGGAAAGDADEVLLRNTFINVRETTGNGTDAPDGAAGAGNAARKITLRWRDANAGGALADEQEAEPPEEPQSPLSAMLSGGSRTFSRTLAPTPGRDAKPGRSALKGSRAVSKDGGAGAIAIQTPKGLVKVSASEIVSKRFGLKFRGSCIILEYEVPSHGLRAHHSMSVKFAVGDGSNGADTCEKAVVAQLRRDHAAWLNGIAPEQLMELCGRLRRQRTAVGGS
eukprot:TRINITY_DN5666_c0_g1_i2.p1 TRINITY_DN5666_c0_g1~~TRINITY_DN5666_c0_g1_i2.p1  ORF type:complete len:405 (+),score=109.31 TRINITY_DN5666_c0_g1_i2:152-1366(+)